MDLLPNIVPLIQMQYCERILAKSGETVLTATLRQVAEPTFWTHYPVGDVYDPESGAHWYYHSHPPEGVGVAASLGAAASVVKEHGHFHCFVRPQGRNGPIHHLVAIGVDAMGQPRRLFTVARHVVDDVDLPAAERVLLLERFDLQLSQPDYLVNRWLTAMVAQHRAEIAELIRQGSLRTQANPALDVTAELLLP